VRRSLRDLAPALLLFAFVALVVAGLPWRCPFLFVTGLPCPTCGMTRATRLALHGDFAGATRMHPLWFVVVPACGALAIGEVASFLRRGAWGGVLGHRWTARVGIVLLVALLVVWFARFAGAFGGPVTETREATGGSGDGRFVTGGTLLR
jgi:hypothetical protein